MQGPPAPDGRRERSRLTRRKIVAAATQLFVTDGYGQTTITTIAGRAGVSVQSVYATFGNKPAILAAALDQAIAGDDAEVVVNDRDWMHDVFHAPSAGRRLTAYAGAVQRIMASAGDMFVVVSTAALVDADLVELATITEQRRRIGATSVINAVLDVGKLRTGLTVDHAIDVLAMLNSPATFHQLVRNSGWSLDVYQAWLGATMKQQLLAAR
jgi:AcrR family transcriptional regulator